MVEIEILKILKCSQRNYNNLLQEQVSVSKAGTCLERIGRKAGSSNMMKNRKARKTMKVVEDTLEPKIRIQFLPH